MFYTKKKREEMERLREAEAQLSQRVADLEEANRVLTDALERDRADLLETRERLAAAESETGRLLLELERERAESEELRARLEVAADVEEEAAKLNARLDRIAKERADFQAKIANLEQTIRELRAYASPDGRRPAPLDFTDLEEETASAPAPAKRPRPVGEPFRPSLPPTEGDRKWLTDLPPF